MAGQCKSLPSSVNEVVSIFFGAEHFITAIMNMKERCTLVHDGLGYSIDTWKEHAIHLLKRFELIPLEFKEPFSFVNGEKCMLLVVKEGNWLLKNTPPVLKQENLYDCGPLACLQLMQNFHCVPKGTKYKSFTTKELCVGFNTKEPNVALATR